MVRICSKRRMRALGSKSAVGLGADQRRNTLDVRISLAYSIFAD